MHMAKYTRREFMKTGVGIGAAALVAGGRAFPEPAAAVPAGGLMRVVSSGNGIRATAKAMDILKSGISGWR
jgi:hypothetical protein